MTDIVVKFENICREAGKVLDEDYSLGIAEPLFVKALNLVKENPGFRKEFESEFLRILDKGIGPFELVEFCMRDLRWPAIREHAIAQLGDSDVRKAQVLQRILNVYEPVWEDEDLYEYFHHGHQSSH
ncbi:hypothetical protein [Dyella sp.]|uniref:hypothetical protein n=1 Tax=Dyella sp. TaxID=1869338 RepID=UPI002845F686|nr:hypothetical protein [Dyella sp.]MDR3443763.1 hypothetical protein [Dyella sp.]